MTLYSISICLCLLIIFYYYYYYYIFYSVVVDDFFRYDDYYCLSPRIRGLPAPAHALRVKMLSSMRLHCSATSNFAR